MSIDDFGASVVPTYETGVFLALNAIENALLVMNSPRCSFVRGMKVFLHNDMASTVYGSTGLHRLVTTEWMGYEDVWGDEDSFAQLLDMMAARFSDRWLLTSQNISSLASGFDLRGLTEHVSRGRQRTIVALEGPQLDGDFLDGYDEVIGRLLPHLVDPRATAGPGEEVQLLLAGHLFCRNEADETANVRELRRLLRGIGLERVALLFAGGGLSPIGAPPAASVLMPHAGRRTETALRKLGLGAERVPLPLGVGGTVAWLRAVGRVTGREEQVEELVARELDPLLPAIQWVAAEPLIGRRVAVVGDPQLGPALVRLLDELGMDVLALFTLSRAATGVADESRRGAGPLPEHVAPTAETFASFVEDRRPEIVVGSGAFSHLAVAADLPYVELGFPSYLSHAFAPRPYLGFLGVRTVLESVFNALLRADERRHARAGASAK